MSHVLVVDDHSILREGLKNLLLSEGDVRRVTEAADSAEALRAVREHDFAVVLLDINLPGRSGLDVLVQIKRLRPGLPVLMLSMHEESQYGLRAIRAGASGYLPKSCDPRVLLDAIKALRQGRRYLTPELADALATAVSDDRDVTVLHETLSNRELDILGRLGRGASVSEIAETLSLSKNTVNTYRSRILVKLQLKNSAELVRYAVEHGLS